MLETTDYNNLSSEEVEYIQTMENLIQSLTKKRDKAVAFRAASGIERRWREDEQLVEGSLDYPSTDTSMLAYATKTAPVKSTTGPHRSMIEINIVRHKCETAMGRFIDIMLPTDTKNWGLSVTPVPELEKALKDERIAKLKNAEEPLQDEQGKPVKISDIAANDLAQAREKMKGMELEIADQLTECDFNSENRKVIKSSVYVGTGIIRGPNVVKKIQKRYECQDTEDGQEFKLTITEKHQPASEWVSCWNIYPDPNTTENVKKTMTHVFERQDISSKDLFDLSTVPGYDAEQIYQVLHEKPIRSEAILNSKTDKYHTIQRLSQQESLYEMWIYYGDLDREDLEVLGVDTSESPEAFSLSACVVFINNHPIKIMLNTLDSGELPYDFFQWSQITGSPWGIGLPRMMMWIQHMINGAMRAMMDNAGDSSGVNVIISSDLQPVDGKYELTGKKLWQYGGDDPQEIDVRKLFAQFQVANNQEELQNIIELAFKLLDLETGVPMIFQGEQQKIPETLGATNIMVDASNVALRSRVKFFDDNITKPHLTKYYHWNMQYNENNDIKGDFNVDPKGTSALIQKDQQLKMLLQILEFKNDPDFKIHVDWDKAIKELIEFLGLNILNSEEKVKQLKEQMAKAPGKDPKIQAAEIKAQSDIEEVKTRASISQEELAFKAEQAQLDRQTKLDLKLLDRDIKMMEFAEKRGISLDQIKAKLSTEAMKLKTQVALTDINGKAPQVTRPAIEPKGRAPEGEAFTK